MQIIALPKSGRVNLNVREGGYLKYSLFVLSMALLKLFWNYFDIWLKRTLSFLLPCPHFPCLTAVVIHPQRLALAEEGAVGGSDAFRTPAQEGPTQKLHPVLFSLKQWGEVFETSSYSAISLPMCCTPKYVL